MLVAPAGSADTGAPPPLAADDSVKDAAREQFMRGVQLFDERRFADSLAEFERSYATYPVFSTLYNIGAVRAALGHSIEAIDAFEKFLAQGGSSISAEQRARVEAELRSERARVGDVRVGGLPPGSQVRIDGVLVGHAPLTEPVRVAAGHHRVEAVVGGYAPALREIDVAGEAHVELTMALAPLAATVPVAPATLPAARSTPSPVDARAPGVREAPPAPGAGQRIAAYSIGGIGLAAAGAGIVVAALGQGKHDSALFQYASTDYSAAQKTESDSKHEKTIGFVVIGAGGAAFLTGLVLYLTAPSGRPSRAGVRVLPWVATSSGGATVEGRW